MVPQLYLEVDHLTCHGGQNVDRPGRVRLYGSGQDERAGAVFHGHLRDGEPQIEPLAALYARNAFLREGLPVLLGGNGALRMVIDRLETRYVDVADERVFANVNTPAEYDAVRQVLS